MPEKQDDSESLSHQDIVWFRKFLEERDEKYKNLFDGQNKQLVDLKSQIEQRFNSSDKLSQSIQQSSKEAIEKQERASESRFESINEFRRTLSDQTQTFMPRTEVIGLLANISKDIQELKKSDSNEGGQKIGLRFGGNIVVVIIGLIIACVASVAAVALIFKIH